MKQGVAIHRVHWPRPGGDDSLVLPIAPTCWAPPRDAIEVDGIALAPKAELHVTVVGARLGRELRATFAAPWLAAAVAAALDAQDWRFTRTGRYWLLGKPVLAAGRRQRAHSLIECIALPAMAPFHRELGQLLGRQLPVPTPHVTLYATAGSPGIGISSAPRLRAFAVREVTGLL
jgi:hypothetical protein